MTLQVSILSMLKGDLSRFLVFYEGVYSGKGQLRDARAVNHEGSISALIFATVVVQEAKVLVSSAVVFGFRGAKHVIFAIYKDRPTKGPQTVDPVSDRSMRIP
ncbi:hypothetical protein I315_02630 [Cryptococcus gattii Ru294]|uniref:Uncharacterized protein n=2 Tax=Cryptococcus gattii TaxID=37769 RepID=E6R9S9_CRYGW|nr:Hypothetical Protein CGB_G5040W [Cryptococcus gattii WM276]KIR54749.1 hypothetical protein I315_02630 [Cryptococcus gattii Ru294]KIR77668.1 hypothetical protein I306_05404 [Cryptococcus gattii EJB2]KIY35974.1 hypothetical protein I305_01550 [Cryptococcus gattii E566]KJE05472.1 hypothetical protein I311_00678 [Cryptococcus gattii NT-10]ADV23571.1 Hypothetical Protein CGB_G5040W [Cryptococcus gattii WM276]